MRLEQMVEPGVLPIEPAAASAPAPRTPPRRPVMRQYELVERVKAYDPGVDEELLNRAYVYAMKAHGSQLRASGDPYFSHPVEVAGILSAWKLDSASIATGLLHDTVEDTGATVDELAQMFGAEVARLVDGVTKLNKLELQSSQTEQAENFRKLLLAMSDDIRVLLVKLADRLHNMRTLHFIPKAQKRRTDRRRDRRDLRPARRAHRHARAQGRPRRSGVHRAVARRPRIDPRPARPAAQARQQPDRADRRRAARDPQRGRPRGRGLRPREDAVLDLAQDEAQERRASSSCPTSWRSASRSTACPTATPRSA